MLKNCKSNREKEVIEEYYTTEYWPIIGRNAKYKVVKYANKEIIEVKSCTNI